MTDFKYPRKWQGKGIIADFRRLLETGDMGKLSPRLYHCLIQSGGFIAHYDRRGFASVYNGRLSELLRGEFYALDNPDRWEQMRHLEDSGYSDGMSAGDVMRAIAVVGAELAPMVREREDAQRAAAEIATARALAAKHGLTVSA